MRLRFFKNSLTSCQVYGWTIRSSVAGGKESCQGLADGEYQDTTFCNRFYTCTNGQATAQLCPVGLLFNPARRECRGKAPCPSGEALTSDLLPDLTELADCVDFRSFDQISRISFVRIIFINFQFFPTRTLNDPEITAVSSNNWRERWLRQVSSSSVSSYIHPSHDAMTWGGFLRNHIQSSPPLTDALVNGHWALPTYGHFFQFPFLPPSQTLYLRIPASRHPTFSLLCKWTNGACLYVNQQKYDLWQNNRLVGVSVFSSCPFVRTDIKEEFQLLFKAVLGYPIKHN